VDFLASGCSDGRFGLWLDRELLWGHSVPVSTFNNPVLASAEEFQIAAVELWALPLPSPGAPA